MVYVCLPEKIEKLLVTLNTLFSKRLPTVNNSFPKAV